MSEKETPPAPPAPIPTPGVFGNVKDDLAAGVVVFLVALPLCLGIALASGAPLMAGLVTGIVGGVVVSWLSGSPLSVSGPAAGLTTIVAAGISDLGYGAFLVAVMLAGVIQIGFGVLRAGVFGYYFPSAVIRGMLSAIGIILILKQIPHAIGHDADWIGDLQFVQLDGQNTLTEILVATGFFQPGAVAIAVVGLVILVGMQQVPALQRFKLLSAPLLVVLLGTAINEVLQVANPAWALGSEHLVQIPFTGPGDLIASMQFPDFSALTNTSVYTAALTVAAVASIETLLCVEAIDKLDPFRRRTQTDRELMAQGVGNALAGLLGGIPMTAVIVRGSANVQAGGRTPLSSFVHGLLLVVSILAVPFLLNHIPLAALAAILLHIGYKLVPAGLVKKMWKGPRTLSVPYFATVVAILFTDLLTGVGIGLLVGFAFILHANYKAAYSFQAQASDDNTDTHRVQIFLGEYVSFLSKASLRRTLCEVPEGSVVSIDASKTTHLDPDVLEIIDDFRMSAPHRNIAVDTIDLDEALAAE